MPIYEYQCAACGQVVERWQKVADLPLTECPVCGGSLHKIISSCAFHLKGSGWYVTDYAGKHAASAGDHGAETKGSESSGEAKAADKATSESPAKSKIK
ncbi:MAG TPA: zinc ribbon domain-containing protein [Desulfobaccales bacterium]|nr:zinc ribbon domain-containing protein [Desulfobaccales bacterium]